MRQLFFDFRPTRPLETVSLAGSCTGVRSLLYVALFHRSPPCIQKSIPNVARGKSQVLPLIFHSFRAPVSTMWERFCMLYGIHALFAIVRDISAASRMNFQKTLLFQFGKTAVDYAATHLHGFCKLTLGRKFLSNGLQFLQEKSSKGSAKTPELLPVSQF